MIFNAYRQRQGEDVEYEHIYGWKQQVVTVDVARLLLESTAKTRERRGTVGQGITRSNRILGARAQMW